MNVLIINTTSFLRKVLKKITSFLVSWYLLWLYWWYHEDEHWPLLSKSPSILNVAFPDFSIEYFMSSFSGSQTVHFEGIIPTELRYWSLTVYDSTGLPYEYWNDTHFPNHKISLTLSNYPFMYYVVVIRYYFPRGTPESSSLLPSSLPTVQVTNSLGEVIPIRKVSDESRLKNSQSIEKKLYTICSRQFANYNFDNVNKYQFFLPNPSGMSLLFPNADAMYLMVFPKTNESFENKKAVVLHVEGHLPKEIGRSYPLRFTSFMASNLKTTRTDDSVSDSFLSPHFHLFVAYDSQDAQDVGWEKQNPSHRLLLWSSTNENPVLIYRQVRTDRNGIFSLKSSTQNVDGSMVEKVMGSLYYPRVIH